MQPTLVITAPVPGLIHINGRLAGETAADSPLFAPVAPCGPVYLEFAPLESGYLPMARRIVLSGGAPMPESVTDGLFAILWPQSVSELELAPESVEEERIEALGQEGRIILGRRPRVELNGRSYALPSGAQTPQLSHLSSGMALTGLAGDEQYLLLLSPDGSRQTGLLRAGQIEFESQELVRTVDRRDDIAGHGFLARWHLTDAGPVLLSNEWIWTDGAPRKPASPEEAARAALEAALLNRLDEAEGYLSPSLRERFSPDAIGQLGSLCLPMRYGMPGGRPCVGLLHLEKSNCARVLPVYYRADQFSGDWLLTELSIDT